MELQKKLEILSAAAKYDVSCSSSGSNRQNTNGGIGSSAASGICHSWSADGRCISLLKILMTNICSYDCAYCVNRASNDVPRTVFSPEEVADLTIGFYRRNYIEGLFLSSAVYKNPDFTMEMMIRAIRKLREEYRFNGYIHMKAIPGSDEKLVSEAGRLVDRISVNIELPSSESLALLAPQKKKDDILKPMSLISRSIRETQEDFPRYRRLGTGGSRPMAPTLLPLRQKSNPFRDFVPAGQSTQLIVGATPDRDLGILRLSENLYHRFQLKRVFYSAYVPVSTNPRLPALVRPPLLREHRLYQADWLLRFYGFTSGELLDEQTPDLDGELDPKAQWAMRNLHLFPVEVNKADYHMLLRVPGIGVRSAQRIIAARRSGSLDFDGLKRLGAVLKRAKYFITCKGKYGGERSVNEFLIRQSLISRNLKLHPEIPQWEQLSLLPPPPLFLPASDIHTGITGEL